MSPTIFREGGFRFFFFSREETRLHVHVSSQQGEAKFWLEPNIELADNYRMTATELVAVEKMIREKEHEIRAAWFKHFVG
ncbi:MAG: DUF4160 domain-containing protein [Magnetococcales bacterium]|nr:DUF4160 domain-containing protein [Magnetococcales bacterium]NGZ28170.1 DUF4160 domain-containing protein [Magnetococcales bacterium]